MKAPSGDQLAGLELEEWEGRSVEAWRREWRLPRLVVFGRVGSTMDALRVMAQAGAPAGTLVLAEEQTAGRGRKGRPWFSAPGWSLHLSLLLRPPAVPEPVLPALPLRVGLAVAAAAEAAAGVQARVKWPNDVVTAGDRKLAGVLCEAFFRGGGPAFVVAGVGINVGQDAEDFPPELRAVAASLSSESGRLIHRPAVLEALFGRLLPLCGAPAGPLTVAELAELRRRDALLGRRLWLEGAAVGDGAGVSPDGALRVRRPDGTLRGIRAGTVRVDAPGSTERGDGGLTAKGEAAAP